MLGTFPSDEAGPDPRQLRLSLVSLAFQAVLTQVLVGIADGAINEAAGYTRERSRPWPTSGLDQAVDDPYVLVGYGDLAATLHAARLLADQATHALTEADARGPALTPTERGRAAMPAQRVHPGYDWFLVLDGRVLLWLGERQIEVEKGEAAEFSTMTPHSMTALDEPAELIMIFDREGQRAHLHQ
ncbi:cupin domain-containing protein [Micromonospora sp. MMS20-R2-23]|uniref:Cupin domain-containing protein n=1 Tax=Micromonospora antibiotica TaxID=2807623 RepID=A0ABS3V6L5_9ACTN|nr:cupin domain-containing protein [Micromonospora antibiotica]